MLQTILIVDDDYKIQRMLIRRLKKAGYQVAAAENGKVGMEEALRLKPDLILMDMHMPVMDGYQAVAGLRKKGYDGLIAAFTASAMAYDSKKTIEAGCDYYIPKPPGLDFENIIKGLIDRSLL